MSRAKIVLADDVELFLMLEKTVFNREEFELITGRDGRAILKIIREAEPDLVFMNLYMPEMNGEECCRLVKQDDAIRHIPVIMVIQGGREEDLDSNWCCPLLRLRTSCLAILPRRNSHHWIASP